MQMAGAATGECGLKKAQNAQKGRGAGSPQILIAFFIALGWRGAVRIRSGMVYYSQRGRGILLPSAYLGP
jgi:hypothetical protein